MNIRLLASTGLALIGLAVIPACHAAEKEKAPLDLKIDPSPLAPTADHPRATSYADVIAPVQPAVVSVYSAKIVRERLQVPEFFRQFYGRIPERESRQEGLGSGVIVSKNGYILTNNHVVEEADELKVALNDGREFEAKLVGADPKTDVAVIKIEADDLPVVTLTDSDNLRVGDLVFAIGNPLGVGQTVTMGIVSATGRQIGILANAHTAGYEDFIQTDAAINQGNSGGALIDAQGRLIGINSAILSSRGGSGNIGIGFAIPINLAASILKSLVETGTVQRGYLGIEIAELGSDVAEALNLKKGQRGVIITNLDKNAPGAKGGLQRSDVIVAVDGKAVATPQELRLLIASKHPGSQVELEVFRDGKKRVVKLEVGSLSGFGAIDQLIPGVSVKPLDDDTRRQIGASRDVAGLIITEVAENSPYAFRLSPGMVVVEINREAVTSIEQAREALRPGRNLFIVYIRGKFSPIVISLR